MDSFNWVKFHDQVKSKYLLNAPYMWWGDDLDVRFYLLKRLIDVKGKKVLDVGCNIGITLSFLDSSNELYGIDIDDFCISKAKELNPQATILKASIDNLNNFDEGYFDVIIMSNVLPGYDFGTREDAFLRKAFREVTRVLSQSGVVYFTTPNGESIPYKHSKKVIYEELCNCFSNADLSGAILGWNSIRPIVPKQIAYSNIKNKYKYVPPKILCKYNCVWRKLIREMNDKVRSSKHFYAEMSKRIVS